MILKGFFDRFKDITNGESGNVTVSQVGDKIGLDVSIISGGSGSSEPGATEATLTEIRDSNSVNVDWDYYDISYVASGNGVGEVETLQYYTGTPGSGTLVLTLSFTYDASSNITRVVRS